jgi:transposase InsO family protein
MPSWEASFSLQAWRPSWFVYRRQFQSRQEAQTAIFAYIEGFYNRRRHSTLGHLSPVEFEQRTSLVEDGVH